MPAEPEARLPAPLPLLAPATDRDDPGPVRTFAGPEGDAVMLRLATPLAYSGERALLQLDPAALRKVDPALLDVATLARRGLVSEDALVRVIVRTELPLQLPFLVPGREFAALGLAAGVIDLDELEAIALLPGVVRVFLDERARAQDVESFELIRIDDVHARTDAQGHNVTGRGVTIAIIDTGVDHTHPELGGCFGAGCKVVGGYDHVNADADPMDDHGHGTHVADTAAGLHGAAPGASILGYKVLDQWGYGWYSDIIAGIENATLAGADIISMSLGGFGTTDGPLAQAADWAVDQGVVVVSAAGNSGCYGCVGEPAASLKGIAVGASTKWDSMAYFSSRGPVYDSDGAIAGIKPDVSAPGMDIVAAVPNGTCQLCHPSGYLSLSGTSMATPHVSGVAALLLQAHPAWSPDDVRGALMGSGVELLQDWTQRRPYDSRTLGASRIDALSALDASVSILPGNGWLGLDVSAPGNWSREWPLTLKAIGGSAVDVSLSGSILARTTRFTPAGIPLPDPTSAPDALVDAALGASDPALNVTHGGPLGEGRSYDLTVTNITYGGGSATATLRTGGNTFAFATLAPVGCSVCNVTFPNVSLGSGLASVRGDGFSVDFRVGLEDVVSGVAPAAIHLEPGQSATILLAVEVDNGVIRDGWADGRVFATTANATYSARASFLKSGIIHLTMDEDMLYVFADRDGQIQTVLFGPPANYDLLADAGMWDFQGIMRGCPTSVASCPQHLGLTAVFADHVDHESETNVSLLRPSVAPRLDTTVTYIDGTTQAAESLPYCNWQPSTTGCHNWGTTFFSRADNNGWFGFDNSDRPIYTNTSWRVGREFEYTRGAETYLIGDFREGVTEDWTLVRNATSFDRRDIEYQPPVGTLSSLQITYCHFTAEGISFGIGNGRAPQARSEPLYFSANDVGRIPAGDDTIPSMPCGAMHSSLVASTNGLVGVDCFWTAGCFGVGRTDFFTHDENGFHAILSPFTPWPVHSARRDGAAVVNDGSSWFGGSLYVDPSTVSIQPNWAQAAYDYVHWFTPASGGAQYLGESDTGGPAYRIERDGAPLSEGTLGRWGIWQPLPGPAQYRLVIDKDETGLETLNGTARLVAEWNASSGFGGIGRIVAPHVTGNGVFGTSFAADAVREASFRIESPATPADVQLLLRNLDTNATATAWPTMDTTGAWRAPLPSVGEGPIEMSISYRGNATRLTLVQTPAFVVAAATGAPNVDITSPAENATVRGVVRVEGTASDPDGHVARVEVSLDGGATWTVANGTSNWTYSFDASTHPENITIVARSYDGALYSALDKVRVRHAANRAPGISILAPHPGASVTGAFVASGVASDPDGGAELTVVEVRVDEGEWVLANGTTSWSIVIEASALPAGIHTLTARVADAYGAIASTQSYFVVVRTPDLAIASLEVVRVPIETSYADLHNDVAERRIVSAVVVNRGMAPSAATNASASANATMHAPGTTLSHASSEPLGLVAVPALQPGENATIEWVWDTVGNVGDHDVNVRVDPLDHVRESREDNNEARVRSWVVVGGLGGAALLGPLGPPDASSVPTEEVAEGLSNIVRAVNDSVEQFRQNLMEAVEETVESPAQRTASALYASLCWSPENPQCRIVSGRPVMGGAFDLCLASPPPNFPLRSLLGPLVWGARYAVDDAASGLLGQRAVCHAYWSNVNATAAQIDGAVG